MAGRHVVYFTQIIPCMPNAFETSSSKRPAVTEVPSSSETRRRERANGAGETPRRTQQERQKVQQGDVEAAAQLRAQIAATDQAKAQADEQAAMEEITRAALPSFGSRVKSWWNGLFTPKQTKTAAQEARIAQQEAAASLTPREREGAFGKDAEAVAREQRATERHAAKREGKAARKELGETADLALGKKKERVARPSTEAALAAEMIKRGDEEFMEMVAEGEDPEAAAAFLEGSRADARRAKRQEAVTKTKNRAVSAMEGIRKGTKTVAVGAADTLDKSLGWTEKQLVGSGGAVERAVQATGRAGELVGKGADALLSAPGKAVEKTLDMTDRAGRATSEFLAEDWRKTKERMAARAKKVGKAGSALVGRTAAPKRETVRTEDPAWVRPGTDNDEDEVLTDAQILAEQEARYGKRPPSPPAEAFDDVPEEAARDIAAAVEQTVDTRRLPRTFHEQVARLSGLRDQRGGKRAYNSEVNLLHKMADGKKHAGAQRLRDQRYDGWTNEQVQSLLEELGEA